MAGKHAGVQALLRQRYIPNAIYVHCYAHKLNLVICDVTKNVPYLSEFYSIISKLYSFFHTSSVTNEVFKQVQRELLAGRDISSEMRTRRARNTILLSDRPGASVSTIKKWAETRWDSRWNSIRSVIDNYPALNRSLAELVDEGTERSTDARGLLFALKEPLFIVTIFILDRLLGKIKILSDQLKCRCLFYSIKSDFCLSFCLIRCVLTLAKSLDFGQAHSLISSVIDKIEELRNEEDFCRLFEQITAFGTANNIDVSVQMRPRRTISMSSRFRDCIVSSTIGQRELIDTLSKYRTSIYYPVIDCILIEMKDRFSNTNIEFLRGISSLSPGSSNFLDVKQLEPLCRITQSNLTLLKNEIEVVKHMLQQKRLIDIIELYLVLLPFKQAIPTLFSLVIIALTVPVSSTTTERTFSKLKLIKTAARNSMSDTRLSDLSLLAIERDFPADFEKIVDLFADKHKNSRIILK